MHTPLDEITRRQILDSSELKEFADENFKFDENGIKLSKRVENIVGKGEIARYEQFLLFPQCFQKACFPGTSKGVIVWEWVKQGKYKDVKLRKSVAFIKNTKSFTRRSLIQPFTAKSHRSVGIVQDLRTGGPGSILNSFRGLTIIIETGIIPLSSLSIVSTMVIRESSHWLGRNIVRSTG